MKAAPFRVPTLLAALLLVATGCRDSNPIAPPPGEGHAARAPITTTDGVRQVRGETGPGALYALLVPEPWNGALVLYAHGFRDPGLPVSLPSQDNLPLLQQRLLDLGYAVAYSSFSENGFAVKDGMQRTQQLRGIFASYFGQPDQTLLVGHSLGALVTLGLAERFPQHYDGVLAMCSLAAGSSMTIDYVGHVRVLFDFFYPGVLPGNVLDVPEGTRLLEDIVLPAQQAMTASLSQGSLQSLQGALAIAELTEGLGMALPVIETAGQQTLIETLVGSIVTVLGFHTRGFQDLIDRTHQHSPFDNTATVYTGALPPQLLAAVNAGVGRYASTPDARNYLQHYYQTSGALQIPLVTLSNAFDPIAPRFQLDVYTARLQQAGNADMYVDRRTSLNPFGHCALTVDETMAAFAELVSQVESPS